MRRLFRDGWFPHAAFVFLYSKVQQLSPFPSTDNSNLVVIGCPVAPHPSVLKVCFLSPSVFLPLQLKCFSFFWTRPLAISLHVLNRVEFMRWGNKSSVEIGASETCVDSKSPFELDFVGWFLEAGSLGKVSKERKTLQMASEWYQPQWFWSFYLLKRWKTCCFTPARDWKVTGAIYFS